jgi:prepilin-type N-terminal cleavage/methylation domain-containing protein
MTFDHSIVHVVRRRGFTLLEVTVAAAMLAMLMGASLQMLRVVSVRQRAADRRTIALEAIQAVSDQVANIPWDNLSIESARRVTIPQPLQTYLPGAILSLSLDDEAAPVPSRRMHVELTWNAPDGQPVAPANLTSWIFPDSPSAK